MMEEFSISTLAGALALAVRADGKEISGERIASLLIEAAKENDSEVEGGRLGFAVVPRRAGCRCAGHRCQVPGFDQAKGVQAEPRVGRQGLERLCGDGEGGVGALLRIRADEWGLRALELLDNAWLVSLAEERAKQK